MGKFIKASVLGLVAVLAISLVPVTQAQTLTQDQILAQIAQLQALLNASSNSSGSCYAFTRSLTVGSVGNDVKALQQWLNANGYTVSLSGAGSVGNESTYFGAKTKIALGKFQAAKGISPAAGYFGPITLGVIKSMCNVGTGNGNGNGNGTGTGTGNTSSNLSVSLSSMNPGASNFAVGTSQLVPVLSLSFTAGSNDAVVTGLNVTRSGLSSDQDLSTVYLMDGSNVVATNLGLSNGVVNFSNSNGLFVVKANTTKTITVSASFASTASGHTFQFSIPSASSITGASVTGNFPIMGNTLTGATVTNLGGVQITNASAGTSAPGLSVNAGQSNFLVGQFTVLAQNQAVQIRSIKLTNTGSINASDVANIKLMNGGTQLGATAPTLVNGNQVVFDLSGSPLQLAAGQSAVIYVYADVVGGVNRYFQFSVQRNYDIVAQDMMYNIGVLPTLASGSFPMNLSYVTVLQGNLTVNRSATSPSTYILPGGTNQVLAKFDLKAAGEAIRITSLDVVLSNTANVTNLRVSDDAGQQIGTTQSSVATTTSYTNLNYIIPANTTRVLSVYIDLASGATGNYSASIANVVGQGFTSLATASYAGPQAGNTLSANSSLLAVNVNSAVGTQSIVAGTNNAKVGSFTLVAGPASAVQVSNISIVAAASTTNAFQNLVLKQGSTQIGQTQATVTGGTTYNFTASSPIVVPAGQQVVIDVYADTKTGISTSTFGGAGGAYAFSIGASGISAVAVSTNQAITATPVSQVNGQTVVIASAGTITYAAYNMPQAAQVGMGTTGIKLATYRVTGSTSEDVLLKDITIKATSTNYSMFLNYRLSINGTQVGSALSTDSSGNLTWYGVNYVVAKNSNPVIDIIADANTWSALQAAGFETSSANGSSTLTLTSITYQGVSSNVSATATNSTASNSFNLLRTTLSAATASGVTLASGVSDAAVVGAVTFTAGAGDDAFINTVTVQHVYSGATTSAANTTFNVYDGNVLVGTGVASTTSGSSVAITLNLNSASTNGVAVPKGTSKTLTIKADLTTAGFARVTAGSAISYQTKVTAWTWTDGTRTGITADPSIPNQPIVGSTSSLSF